MWWMMLVLMLELCGCIRTLKPTLHILSWIELQWATAFGLCCDAMCLGLWIAVS